MLAFFGGMLAVSRNGGFMPSLKPFTAALIGQLDCQFLAWRIDHTTKIASQHASNDRGIYPLFPADDTGLHSKGKDY